MPLARFADIAGTSELIYSFSHLREGKPEVRETAAGEPGPGRP
ncbi:MAG: hypothetical protein ACJ76Y_30105 [Thermoanaerobaculia bacterium]